MDEILTLFVFACILLLSILHNTYGQRDTPEGCSILTSSATTSNCDFQLWKPPLNSREFRKHPLEKLVLRNINGQIPAEAFSGLRTKTFTSLSFICESGGKVRLSSDVFTQNLQWLQTLQINNCNIETGFPSRGLENLRDLTYFTIQGSDSDFGGPVAPDAFVGLVKLQRLNLNVPLESEKLPLSLFKYVKKLTRIHLSHANLTFIPANWFNGLGNLQELILSYNNLKTLPEGLFEQLLSLKTVYLRNNPWYCSCELMKVLNKSVVTDEPVCKNPPELTNFKLEDAFNILDCTSSTSTSIPTAVSTETKIKTQRTSLEVIDAEILNKCNNLSISVSSDSTPTTTREPATVIISKPLSSPSTGSSTLIESGTQKSMLILTLEKSAQPTDAPKSYYTKASGSLIYDIRYIKDAISSDIRLIALASFVGELTVLLVVTAVCQCICRKTCSRSVNRVGGIKGEKHGTEQTLKVPRRENRSAC